MASISSRVVIIEVPELVGEVGNTSDSSDLLVSTSIANGPGDFNCTTIIFSCFISISIYRLSFYLDTFVRNTHAPVFSADAFSFLNNRNINVLRENQTFRFGFLSFSTARQLYFVRSKVFRCIDCRNFHVMGPRADLSDLT